MSIKYQIKILDLFKKIVNGDMNKIAYIDYAPQKMEYEQHKNIKPFKRSTPEEQGISSYHLLDFLKTLDAEESILTQGIMIVRNNTVILEVAYKPYDLDIWRITHSLCKSLVGIAVGIAIEENYFTLDDTITSIFSKESWFLKALQHKEIKIRNLLEMSSGITFNEIGSLLDTEWSKLFLDAQTTFEPGSTFSYNSMNTYMLSAVIQEKTKQNIVEFLDKRLLEPMGITNICWEQSPEKIIKGGWGLYMSLEDRTKLGQLILNKGKWKGKQLVSANWIEQMTAKHMDTPKEQNEYGYGYQGWIGKSEGSFIMNGLLGQNVIVIPKSNMVISVISSNVDVFVKSRLLDIIEHFFMSEDFCPQDEMCCNPSAVGKLKNYLAGCTYQEKFAAHPLVNKKSGWKIEGKKRKSRYGRLFLEMPEDVRQLYGKACVVEENNASLIPLFIQTMQNNFSKGITRFQFQHVADGLQLYLEEHEMVFEIPIGFKRPKYTVMNVHGEKYQISAWGRISKTEDDIPVLDLQICFLETTNCRTLRFYFNKDSIHVKFREYPEPDKILDQVLSVLHFALPASGLETIKNTELVKNKILQMVEPELKAVFVNNVEKALH